VMQPAAGKPGLLRGRQSPLHCLTCIHATRFYVSEGACVATQHFAEHVDNNSMGATAQQPCHIHPQPAPVTALMMKQQCLLPTRLRHWLSHALTISLSDSSNLSAVTTSNQPDGPSPCTIAICSSSSSHDQCHVNAPLSHSML
jgi:hypothetical protein